MGIAMTENSAHGMPALEICNLHSTNDLYTMHTKISSVVQMLVLFTSAPPNPAWNQPWSPMWVAGTQPLE